jgi:hypothetical protein
MATSETIRPFLGAGRVGLAQLAYLVRLAADLVAVDAAATTAALDMGEATNGRFPTLAGGRTPAAHLAAASDFAATGVGSQNTFAVETAVSTGQCPRSTRFTPPD